MSPVERQFLEALSKRRQGRVGYSLVDYEKARPHVQGLLDSGLIKDREYGFGPGFQITEAGREYLGGSS